jgi:hypothetical protein
MNAEAALQRASAMYGANATSGFGGRRLTWLIIDALPRADGRPLSTPAVADSIIAAKGYSKEARHALIRRVRAKPSCFS